jgi:hypothetical protein
MMMTDEQDLILGVFANFGFEYPGIEQYMVSIARSGYRGRKVLLCWNVPPPVRNMLIRCGYELVFVDPPAKETHELPCNFFIHRMKVVAEYLSAHKNEFRFVFWLDIKDLVLQNNPSRWMEQHKGNAKIIASTECVTIAQEETNAKWVNEVCGPDMYEQIKDEEVINGGTFAGEPDIMATVFDSTYQLIKDYKGPWPACQPTLNYVLRFPDIAKHVRIPRWTEGFAACLHPMWATGQKSGVEWNPRDLCRQYLRDVPPAFDMNTKLLYARGVTNPASMGLGYVRWGAPLNFIFLKETNPMFTIELIDATPKDVPFCIVHGWDRDAGMKHIFEQNYSLPRLQVITDVYNDLRTFLQKGKL